jgi:membrane protease YdiL (CAAX protease family)
MGLQIFPNTSAQEQSSPREATPNTIALDGKHVPIASRSHLAILLTIQAAIALNGSLGVSRLAAIRDPAAFQFYLRCSYLFGIGLAWFQVFFVVYGLRKTQTSISSLIGGRWNSTWAVVKDFLLGVAFWLLWMVVLTVLVIAFQPHHAKTPSYIALLPRTTIDIGLWLAISLSAGFCEEIVFRGYLQRQFLALTKNQSYAVIGQAIVFGLGHAYQGPFNMMAISVEGILLGWLAARRKSLRPGMIAHAWQDAIIGVLFFAMNHKR